MVFHSKIFGISWYLRFEMFGGILEQRYEFKILFLSYGDDNENLHLF